MLYGEDPVSDLSLHMLRAPRSVLWVVGCGSLVTPIPPTRARLRARRYGLWASQGQEPSKELTARTLLIPRINALGLTTSFFFTEYINMLGLTASRIKHTHVIYVQHLYKYINVCLGPRASNSLSSYSIQVPLHSGY